jgi:hypothetical protein
MTPVEFAGYGALFHIGGRNQAHDRAERLNAGVG